MSTFNDVVIGKVNYSISSIMDFIKSVGIVFYVIALLIAAAVWYFTICVQYRIRRYRFYKHMIKKS